MTNTASARRRPEDITLDQYPRVHRMDMRWGDIDAFGHLNNVAIAQIFEEARAALSAELIGVEALTGGSDLAMSIARVELDYFATASWPTVLEIGLGTKRVGNSSFHATYALFAHGQCISASDAILVLTRAGTPITLPPSVRESLTDLLIETEDPHVSNG